MVIGIPLFTRWMWREGASAALVLRTAVGRFWQCVFCRQISATPYRLRDCGHVACGLCIWRRGLPKAPINQLFLPILFHCQCGSGATRRPRRANADAANATANWIIGRKGRARQCAWQPRLFPPQNESNQPTLFSSFSDDAPDPFYFVGFPGDYIDGDFVGAVSIHEMISGQLFNKAFQCLVFALRCKVPDKRTHDGYYTFSIFSDESRHSQAFSIRTYGEICRRFISPTGVDWSRLTPHDTIVLSRCRDARPFRSCIIIGWSHLARSRDLEFILPDINRLDSFYTPQNEEEEDSLVQTRQKPAPSVNHTNQSTQHIIISSPAAAPTQTSESFSATDHTPIPPNLIDLKKRYSLENNHLLNRQQHNNSKSNENTITNLLQHQSKDDFPYIKNNQDNAKKTNNISISRGKDDLFQAYRNGDSTYQPLVFDSTGPIIAPPPTAISKLPTSLRMHLDAIAAKTTIELTAPSPSPP
mmetsp:Transcript_23207/g.30033  ORF Transcript_23207/g.30033 Transcript_23207/m.30033 type:complete len:472 (-) Transcript_23207:1621-3036(-)